jgi:hypothetical protein
VPVSRVLHDGLEEHTDRLGERGDCLTAAATVDSNVRQEAEVIVGTREGLG